MFSTILAISAILLVGSLTPLTAARKGTVEDELSSLAAWPWPIFSTEFRISQPTVPECTREFPRIAYNWVRQEYIVIWYNYWSPGFHDIYARRITSAGEIKSWFTVATGAGGDEKSRWLPSLAYNAQNNEYLVVYMRATDGIHHEVWGRRVAWDGSYLGPEFLIFSWPNRAFWTPRVAWNSYRNEWLVIANAHDTSTGLWNDVAGRRVMANGTTPYPGHSISAQNQTLQPHAADVAYNLAADEYLVIWRQRFSGDDWDIHGARVRGDNDAVVTPPGVFMIDDTYVDQRNPAIATNQQDRYLVVWQHGVGLPATDWNIRGWVLNVNGSPTIGVSIAYTVVPEQYPALTMGGANSSNPFIAYQYPAPGGGFSIRGVTWTPSTQDFQIASNTTWTPPAVAAGPPGYLIVYGRAEGSAVHIWGRLVRGWYAVHLPLVLRN